MSTLKDPFPGKTVQWLQTRLDECLDELASGGSVLSSSTGDVSVSRANMVALERRRDTLLLALHIRQPAFYKLDQVRPIKATQGRIRQSFSQ